ncbi:MAG TPA: serine hydrolase domain-containing protein, partial [Chthoniobacterales bacterium]
MRLDEELLREKLKLLFDENFSRFGELGAAVSVWQHGMPLLELHGGFRDAKREKPWTADTIVLFWSATKGLGSACLLHALQERAISLERRVAEFWPEFVQAGKGQITVGELMSHQAGLSALDEPTDVLDYPAVIAALEKQSPLWPPGTAHGYHARTFGFLVDEFTRRLTGQRVSEYWRSRFAEPLDLDIWIGLPEAEQDRA